MTRFQIAVLALLGLIALAVFAVMGIFAFALFLSPQPVVQQLPVESLQEIDTVTEVDSGSSEDTIDGSISADDSPEDMEDSADQSALSEPTEEAQEIIESVEPEVINSELVIFEEVVGLDELSSYRVTSSIEFSGKSHQKVSNNWIETLLEATNEPLGRHIKSNISGSILTSLDDETVVKLEYYVEDGIVYSYNSNLGDEWTSLLSRDDSSVGSGVVTPDEMTQIPQIASCNKEPE